MATFAKRGSRWQAQIFVNGIRRCKTFARKDEARAWAAEAEIEIRSGRVASTAGMTVAEMFTRYADEVSETKRGARWERIRLEAIGREEFARMRADSITPEILGQWRDRRLTQVSPGTVLREIGLLTAVFEHARREWRAVTVNPTRDVRKPKQPQHRERLISDDEAAAICRALDYDGGPGYTVRQRIGAMFMLALETAMRAGEINGLRWDRVDTKRRVARLTLTKNGDGREVPLSARAAEIIEAQRGADPVRVFPVNPGSRDTLFRLACKEAGLEDIHFHDTRATACTRLAANPKIDVLKLARILGHRDISSLRHYYRQTAEDLAKEL
jgi:integrase